MPLSALDRDRILVAKSKTTAKLIQLSEQLYGQLLEKDSLPSNELSADLHLTLQTVISDDSSVRLFTDLPRRQVWNFAAPNRASTFATNDPASIFSTSASGNAYFDSRNGNEYISRNTNMPFFGDYSSQQELPIRQTRRLPVDVRSSGQSNYQSSYQPQQQQQYQPEAYTSSYQFTPSVSTRHHDGYGQRSQEIRSHDTISRILSRMQASLQPSYEPQSTQSTHGDAEYHQYVLDQEYRIWNMANIGASTDRQRPVSYSASVNSSIPIRPNGAQFTVSAASTFRTQFAQPASTSRGQVLTGEPQNDDQAYRAYQEELSEEYRRFLRNQSLDNPPSATAAATQREQHNVSSRYEPQTAPSTREQEGSTRCPLNWSFSQHSSRVSPSFTAQRPAPRIVTPEPARSRAASPSTWPASSWTIRTTPPPSTSRQISPDDSVSSSSASNGNGGSKRKSTTNVYAVMVDIHFLKCTEKDCRKTFPSMMRLNEHRKFAHKICEARCPLVDCRFSSNKISKLIKHRSMAHRDLTAWPCNRSGCTKRFPNQLELTDHLEMEHISGRFLCTFAGCHFESSISQQDVKNHFTVVHRGISITPPLENAPSSSQQQQASVVDDHLSANDDEDVKEPAPKRAKLSAEEGGSPDATRAIPLGWRSPTPTSTSPQAATSEPPLGESAAETSFIMEYLVCLRSDCNYESVSTADWNAHMEAEHNIHPYRCPMARCLASFTQSHQLAKHRESAHRNVPIWQCDCLAEFATASELSEHRTLEHFGGRFTCTVDGCSFKEETRARMKAHFEAEHASGGHSSVNEETIQVKEEYFSAGEQEDNPPVFRNSVPQEAGDDDEEKVAI